MKQLEKGREFSYSGGKKIVNVMMVSKGITLLVKTATLNKDIRGWRLQTTNLDIWAKFKTFFHQSHREQRREVATVGKGGYTVAIKTYTV